MLWDTGPEGEGEGEEAGHRGAQPTEAAAARSRAALLRKRATGALLRSGETGLAGVESEQSGKKMNTLNPRERQGI